MQNYSQVETTDPRYDGSQVAGHFIQNRFVSKNQAYIALERSSSHKLKVCLNVAIYS